MDRKGGEVADSFPARPIRLVFGLGRSVPRAARLCKPQCVVGAPRADMGLRRGARCGTMPA